jgi:Holliday junction resolvase
MPLRSTDKLDRSRKQEKRLAKSFGGKTRPGSGNKEFYKGDIKSKIHLIEAKTTEKKQIILKLEWLEKIRTEACRYGRIPALAIEIGGHNYIVIQEDDFITATGGNL